MHCEHFDGEAHAPQLETAFPLCESCGGQVFLVDVEGKLGTNLEFREQSPRNMQRILLVSGLRSGSGWMRIYGVFPADQAILSLLHANNAWVRSSVCSAGGTALRSLQSGGGTELMLHLGFS